MKKIYLPLLAIFILQAYSFAQNIGINADGSEPNANAMLDIKSNTKGILIPRTSTTSRKTIPNTKGLLLYDSTVNSFWYNDGTKWTNLSAANSGWSLNGNANTDTSGNYIGTTDAQPLVVKVRDTLSGLLTYGNPYITSWGFGSLMQNTTGSDNTALGSKALYNNTTGSDNVALGNYSGYNNATGSGNTSLGFAALNYNTANYNTGIGSMSLQSNTTGTENTAVGWQAAFQNSTGAYNTAVGAGALLNNKSGYINTAVGDNALRGGEFAWGNVAIGFSALGFHNEGFNNTAVGNYCSYNNSSGTQNTAIGDSALYQNDNGSVNTAAGNYSLMNNTSGGLNTALGVNALRTNTTGTDNTAVGVNSLVSNDAGNQNTAIGSGALYGATGSNNTAMGYLADVGPLSHNASAFGSHAVATASNTIRLGDNNVISIISTGTFNTLSDGRFKFNVKENVKGLDFILRLRPVTYQVDVDAIVLNEPTSYNTSPFKNISKKQSAAMLVRRSGFIAQEVEKAAIETGFDFDAIHKPENGNDHYSLSYAGFVVPIVKSIQELNAESVLLKKQVKNADEVNKNLQNQMKSLIEKINVLNQKLENIAEGRLNSLNEKSLNKSK